MSAGGPRIGTSDMTLFGVYYGVVTQNKDPENKARVKVRLPWLDHGDVDQTHWAMVSAPMSGAKFGWYTLPDVGDNVALMFIAGDVNQPVVLGGVWSKTDKPPEEGGDGKNDFRGYRSRSGGRVIMDDSSNGKVYFSDKTDKNIVVVGSFQKGGAGNNAHAAPTAPVINGPAGQSGVCIASEEGEMNITAKGKLKVTGMNIEISSKSDNVEIKASKDVNLEGGLGNCNGGPSVKAEGSQTKIN